MKAAMTPNILFVDDNASTTPQLLRKTFEPHGLEVKLAHPENVVDLDLQWADVVVVDYFLTEWPERDASESAARAPADGLAVAATLRSRLLPSFNDRFPGALPGRPVAFALWSGHLSQATFELPDVVLPHVFSRENNLEWAFARTDLLTEKGGAKLAALAFTVKDLPEAWESAVSSAEDHLLSALRLDSGADWAASAREDVVNSKPPLHELASRTRGMAIVRWLLHRILPYPTFLIDERQLRARLRVEALSGQGEDSSPLLEALESVRYKGALASFAGPRWWRAGVEDWVFTQTAGQAGDPRAVASLATALGATTSREWLRPVIVLDAELRPRDEFVEVEDVVRVAPDDWPPYADDAFASRIEASQDPSLRRLVHSSDRALLAPPAEMN